MDIVKNGKGTIRLRFADGSFVEHLVSNLFCVVKIPIEFDTLEEAEAYRQDLEEKTIWKKIG